jgi:hypothetical protein
LAGYWGRTVSKLCQEVALDWIFIRRKDYIWLEIKKKFPGLFNMLQWTTESQDKYHDNKKISSFGKKVEESKALPLLNQMGDGKQGVNWGELNKTIMEGFYQDGKFSPNVESDDTGGWKYNKSQHREQKNQQIARIITAMLGLEVYFVAYIEKYRKKYTWRWATMPGEVKLDYKAGKLRYVSPPSEAEEELDDTGQPQPKQRPDLDDISEGVWLQKKEQGEAVEKTHYLEYLSRKKKRTLATIKSKNAAAQEVDQRNIKAIDKAMKAFSRTIYLPPIGQYDKDMNRIEGFKIFKAELRKKLELMWIDRQKGIEKPMKPICLLGPPGVGKTQIVKTYAKAMRRPLVIISMGGATDTKDIEGTPPTFQNANWSRLLEGMSMINVDIFVELDELKEQLAEYEAIKNKTEFQQQEIKELKELIKDMEDKGEKERKIDANSKAPIALFDEAEKAGNQGALDALGKVLDPNANTAHWDKFFEGYLNLKFFIFFVTMNDEWRCPQFIKDRCDMIDIEILTYEQRIKILDQFARIFIREGWPIMDSSGKKPDLKKNKDAEDADTLTTAQQKLRDKIGNEVIKACVTETWGVRQSIMNIEKVVDLMRIVEKDGTLSLLSNFDNWDWDSDKDGVDDEVSDKTRTLKYNVLVDVNNNPRPLQLNKVVHQDIIPLKDNKNKAKVKTVKNTIPYWPDYSPMVDELVNPESKETTQTSSDAHEKEIERLKKEMEKMKKHCKEKLAEKDKLTEQQKTVIETTLDELEASKGNAQELQNKVDNLTVRLSEFTTRPITATTDQGTQTDEPTINTLTIKYVPTNGKLRFGVNNWQKTVQVLKFDEDEGKKIKNLRITDCKDIIQIDLSNLTNLEKISLRSSKWDNIKGAKNIIPNYKVVVKDCQDVSLAWVEGTNVGIVEIDKPSSKTA